MIDVQKIIVAAGYNPTAEFEKALGTEIERLANNPALADKVFKRLFRAKSKRAAKGEQGT